MWRSMRGKRVARVGIGIGDQGASDVGNFSHGRGGTGGHVIPALAVARELRRRGHEVFFVGTERGMEGRLVPAEGSSWKRSRSAG